MKKFEEAIFIEKGKKVCRKSFSYENFSVCNNLIRWYLRMILIYCNYSYIFLFQKRTNKDNGKKTVRNRCKIVTICHTENNKLWGSNFQEIYRCNITDWPGKLNQILSHGSAVVNVRMFFEWSTLRNFTGRNCQETFTTLNTGTDVTSIDQGLSGHQYSLTVNSFS
jgi:hypothetical protein